jgi:hypothetical protein
MEERYKITADLISKSPTDIWGLKFLPSLEPHCDNDQDMPYSGWTGYPEITDCNLEACRSVMQELGDSCSAIMEIGVNRNGESSMSQVFMNMKPDDCVYVGVDINDKSDLNDASKNIYTLQCNSHEQDTVRAFLAGKGVTKLDLLMIDGWHSINSTINDWLYADLLSDHGIVLVHDINTHPGDIALCEAVDELVFEKHLLCPGHDYGIAVFKRHNTAQIG